MGKEIMTEEGVKLTGVDAFTFTSVTLQGAQKI